MSCRLQVPGRSDGRAGIEGSGRGDTVRVCFCGRFTSHVCNKIRRCWSSTSLFLSLNSSAGSSKQLLGLLGLLIGCLLHRLEELGELLRSEEHTSELQSRENL